MEQSQSILETVREAVGLPKDETAFDPELIIHINGALATLNQNGIGKPTVVKDGTASWTDFKNEGQLGNYMFEQIKMFVFIKTKMLFDPPPPSTVKYMDESAKETLWRLRESYDVPEEDLEGGEV